MDTKEAAAALNGSQYRDEGSPELFETMREAGLVAVFGASDDLMEFRGAINDEVGCYNGGTAWLTKDGLLQNQCEEDDCPYFQKERATAATISAIWDDEDSGADALWSYRTDIPHETFAVMEDDETYCRGIVFRLTDVS